MEAMEGIRSGYFSGSSCSSLADIGRAIISDRFSDVHFF